MEGERRTLRGRSAGIRKGGPLSVQTSYANTPMPLHTPLPSGRQSPSTLVYPDWSGSPRDTMPTPVRQRPESLQMPSSAGLPDIRSPAIQTHRRSLASATPSSSHGQMADYFDGRAPSAFSNYGSDRGLERERERERDRYVQSPRGAVPVPPTPAQILRTRRPSFAQPADGMERPRRGSLLQNEIPMLSAERPRRMSMMQSDGPPLVDRHRRPSMVQPLQMHIPVDGVPPPLERTRRQSFQQGLDGERARRHSLFQAHQHHIYQQQLREQQAQQVQHTQQMDEITYSPGGYEPSIYSPGPERIPRPSSAAATNSSNGEIIRLTLVDLDCVLDTVKMKARPGFTIQRVGDGLLDRFNMSTAETFVTFYRGISEMRKHDQVYDECTLYYRIVGPETRGTGSIEDPAVQLEIQSRRAMSSRFPELRQMLKKGILSGFTVGEFRETVARMLEIDDADDLLIEAHNGMHPGPLEGQDWRLCDVARGWLCSKFYVCHLLSRRVIKMRLLGTTRRYIFHTTLEDEAFIEEEEDDVSGFCDASVLKERFSTRVIHGTDAEPNASQLEPGVIRLYSPASKRQVRKVRWGSLVDVELAPETFVELEDQESWLLGPRSLCSVCCEEHYDYEFVPATPHCEHNAAMCSSCLNNSLRSQLEDNLPETITCPETTCNERLSAAGIARWALPALAERFDTLMTTSLLRNISNFYWCAAPCGSGQIHLSQCPEMTCVACGFIQCILHPGPWHIGRTCREVDADNAAQPDRHRAEDRMSRRVIREVARKCPECASPVELRSGCNHITCSCGAQWCYLCLGEWECDRVSGMWHCRHRAGCQEARERPMFEGDDDVPERFRATPGGFPTDEAAVGEEEDDRAYGSGEEYGYDNTPTYARVRTPARSVAGESAYQYDYEVEAEPEVEREYWRGEQAVAAPRQLERRERDRRPPRSEWQRPGVQARVGRRGSLHRRE